MADDSSKGIQAMSSVYSRALGSSVNHVEQAMSSFCSTASGSGVDHDEEATVDGQMSLKMPFVCGLCQQDFDKIETYYTHFKQHDMLISSRFHVCCESNIGNDSGICAEYTCSSCLYNFSSICLLHDHLLDCSKSGSYFYDNQQMAACPVDFCLFSNFRNENGDDFNSTESTKEDLNDFVGHTTDCDSKDISVTFLKDEDRNKNIEDVKADSTLDKVKEHSTSRRREDNILLDRRNITRKKKGLRMPKKLDDSITKLMRKSIRIPRVGNGESKKIKTTQNETCAIKTKRKTRNKALKSNKLTSSSLVKKERKVMKNKKVMVRKNKKEKKGRTYSDSKFDIKKSRNARLEDSISVDEDIGANDEVQLNDEVVSPISDAETDVSCDEDIEDESDAVNKTTVSRNRFDETAKKYKTSNGTRPRKGSSKEPREEDLKCAICGAIFDTVRECKVHCRGHRTCHICCKTYLQFRALRIHMRSHDEVQPFPCTICGRGFNEKRSLQSHMITHTDDKPFKCDKCPAAYKHPHTLKIHVRSHSKVMPYCCEICGDGFVDWCTLKRHKLHKHSDERPFKCQKCGAGFKDNYKLRRHTLTHSAVKQHQCEVCGMQMSTRSSLAMHMKKHQDREMHECSECNRKFVSKYILRDHQRTHSGERPYKCPSCPKAHIKRAELRKHMLKHHDVDLDNLDIYPSRKHIIMGKVGALSRSEDVTMATEAAPNPVLSTCDAAQGDAISGFPDAPVDLSFLSEVADSLPQKDHQQQQHNLTLTQL